MEFTCQCRNSAERWNSHICILNATSPYELEVNARGSNFHMIVGKHSYGNYLCIPNWGIGTELSLLTDRFWNAEHLKATYPELSTIDVSSITDTLAALGQHIIL